MNTLQRSYKMHHFTLTVRVSTLPGETEDNKKQVEHACKINAQLVNDQVFE